MDGFRLRSRIVLNAKQLICLELAHETFEREVLWVAGLEAGGVFLSKSRLAV